MCAPFWGSSAWFYFPVWTPNFIPSTPVSATRKFAKLPQIHTIFTAPLLGLTKFCSPSLLCYWPKIQQKSWPKNHQKTWPKNPDPGAGSEQYTKFFCIKLITTPNLADLMLYFCLFSHPFLPTSLQKYCSVVEEIQVDPTPGEERMFQVHTWDIWSQ